MAKHSKKLHLTLLALTGAVALGTPGTAHANQYGELRISTSTTLHDNRFGNIVFDAPNVTLDCAGYQVHISSFTKARGPNGEKVGIYAAGKNGITIRNCNIVGEFDVGLWVSSSSSVYVDTASAGVGSTHTGFRFDNNSGMVAGMLTASGDATGVLVTTDDVGFYQVLADTCSTGVEIDGSTLTQLGPSLITDCDTGVQTNQSDHVWLTGVDAEDNLIGLSSYDDTLVVNGNEFNNNSDFGADIFQNTNSSFNGNEFTGNGTCDAWQHLSTGDTWSGNTIGHLCGTVPTPH